MRKQLILLALALQLASLRLAAQPQGAWSYRHFTTEDGLSHDVVTTMAKDKRGFLWVGTKSGLNRFDGRTFLPFYHQPGQPNSLPGNFIFGINTDRSGLLWVSTSHGLCRLDPDSRRFEQVPLPGYVPGESSWVGEVMFDSMGTPWVCGLDSIYSIDPKTLGSKGYVTGTKSAAFNDVCMDKRDRFWMTTGGSIYCFDTKKKNMRAYVSQDVNPTVFKAFLTRIQEAPDGKIYFLSADGHLFWLDPTLDAIVPYPHKLPFPLDFLAPDKDESGKPFFWTSGGGQRLATFYPENGALRPIGFSAPGGTSSDVFQNIGVFKDPTPRGPVWLATFGGLTQLAPRTVAFGLEEFPMDEKNAVILTVLELAKNRADPSGNTYFIFGNGRNLYEWNKAEHRLRLIAPTDVPEYKNRLGCMMQDSRGMVWLGDVGRVKRYDPRTGAWRTWVGDEFPLPANRGTVCAFEDRSGNIWFGTSIQQLLKFNPQKQRLETVKLPMSNDPTANVPIKKMAEDSLGNLWMSNSRNQLFRFTPRTLALQSFSLEIGDAQVEVSDLLFDEKGRFWVSSTAGLLELDYEARLLRRLTQADGLKSDYIGDIQEDADGRIWCGTDNLLHCYNPATNTFTYFGKKDGLKSNNTIFALAKSHDGELLVGFEHAFGHFDPAQLQQDMTPPTVAVTSLRVMKEERNPAEPVVLRPGENFLSVEFTALNFSQSGRNQYAYRLEGFDEDWVYTDRPVATYTNLDGGSYTLLLKAANSDGIWNEEGISLPIKVIPPLRKRWYFKLFLAILLTGAMSGIWWLRRQQRTKIETFRESLARDLHDEMGSTLSSIRFFSEFARQQVNGGDAQAAEPILQRISTSVSSASESMQDIIWAMKNKDDSLEDLAARMTEFGLRLMESKGVAFKTHVGEGFSGKQLSPEQRRNAYLIFKEAMNNAAKYSEATVVELHLALKKGLLLMKISDNGKGFEPGSLEIGGGGNGLKNMQQRATDIGGKVEIFSNPGEGTRVELRVRV